MVKINLSTILGKYRMSQAELARKTGIRPSTICDIYNEMCDRINLEHLDRICEVLECDISDILEYQPNKIKKTGKYLIVDRKKHNKNTKHLADEWNLCKVFFICRKHFCNNMQKWLIQFFHLVRKVFLICAKSDTKEKEILADISNDTDKETMKSLKQEAKAEKQEYSQLKKLRW